MERRSINNKEIGLTPRKKLGRSPTEDISKSLPKPQQQQQQQQSPATPRRKSVYPNWIQVLDSPKSLVSSSEPSTSPTIAYHPKIPLKDTLRKTKGGHKIWSCPFKVADGTFCQEIKPSHDQLNILEHYWAKHLDQLYTCSELGCGKTFEHKTVHKGQGYQCFLDECDGSKHYTIKAHLDAHVNSVHLAERFICPEETCQKSYSHKNTLITHVRLIHKFEYLNCRRTSTDENGMEKQCPYGFKNYNERIMHEKYDHDTSGYCTICNFQPQSEHSEKSHPLTKTHQKKEMLLKYYELGEGAFGPNSKFLIQEAKKNPDTQEVDPTKIRLISAPKVAGIVPPKGPERGTVDCGGLSGCHCNLRRHFNPLERYIIKDTFAVEVNDLFLCNTSNFIYKLTCAIHDNFWYFGLSEQEAKRR